MNVKEKDEKYFGRGAEPQEIQVVKAEGSFLYDENGKEYIDFLGDSGVCTLGWGLPEIEDAIRNSDRPTYIYPNFYYKPWTKLAELLAEITPPNLVRSFRTTGGSEAVEAAMQMAMMYTGRKKFLSIEDSYHGNTIGTLSLGSSSNSKKFPNLLSGCEKVELPLDEKALKKIEDKLKNNEFAAVIMEPVICNLGVIIPENDFMKKLRQLCNENGTLLVMDEAITGFGRTGKLFATEHFDIEADIMCLAKAMSAGHAGMGAVITTEEIAEKVEEEIGLYSSYGWHPISVDAAIANINYWKEHKDDLFQNIEKIAGIFKEELPRLKFKNEAVIRIIGLAIGIDVKDDGYAEEIMDKCLKEGLLMNTEGSSIVFFPALNISEATVRKGIGIISQCI
jgi:acetylornithine/succinyldiaminopimelate/putrescine aminotransferase